jgi:polysaccharide biosynthesis protein PslH
MKVLQLYYKMPFPMHDGGACSVYSASLSILSQDIDLRILAMNTLKTPGNADLIPGDFVRKTGLESVNVDNRIKPIRAAKSIFGTGSYFAGRFWSAAFRDRLIEILKKERFDIIQMEHLYLCQYLADIRKVSGTKVVLRAQNIENRIWHDYTRRMQNPFLRGYLEMESRKLEQFELQMAAKVDGIIALTATDAEYFRSTAGGKAVDSIPVGVDLSRLAGIDMDKQYLDFPVIYHLGSMDWRPNIQGLDWFVENVLPVVARNMPGIRICIAGRNMPGRFLRNRARNLVVEGVVDDALKYQEDKAILVVPLLSGSGIRVKILEAMALGKTVISTSVGAAGIHAVHNESILVADNPEEFAAQICRCAASEPLCRKIGRNAREAATKHYGTAETGMQMKRFYQKLLS